MKEFCYKCGSEIKAISKKPAYYNVETGKPTFKTRYRCPKIRWWDWGDWFPHTDEWRYDLTNNP